MNRKFRTFFLLALLPGCVQLYTQASVPEVSLSVDLVAWGDDISGLSVKSTSNGKTYTAMGFRYSEPIAYSGPALMEIHRRNGSEPNPANSLQGEQMTPARTGTKSQEIASNSAAKESPLTRELDKRREENPSLVALVALPTYGSSHVTVLLAPAANGTLMSYVIDDDSTKLPSDHIRVQNLSPMPIMMRFDGKFSVELPSRESVTIPVKNEYVIYELAYKKGEHWRMHENNIIRVSRTERTQMLVLRSNNSYFTSSDGSMGGFLQTVTLRRRTEK